MRLVIFIGIALLSGVVSGLILSGVNLIVVEPFIDRAIDLEIKNARESGEDVGSAEGIAEYRYWQKGGQVIAGTILGLSMGSLFALIYGFAWPSLRGSNGIKKGLFLAAIMWLTIFLIPFLKYPANPPAVGDPETIYYRQSLYLFFGAASGLGALGFAFLYRSLRIKSRKILVPALYVAYISSLFVMFPPNPDAIMIPMELVNAFRLASGLTVTLFWFILGALFGVFWDRFKPYMKITTKL